MDVSALLVWYDAGHRDLPWRRTRDPWAILVSEVMLQQTQAARVVPHYVRFLARFPAARDLAAASPADAIAAWSGLGYNRRALALRAAARRVAEEGWPRDALALQALPGVGSYTAAAVASFAFGQPVAAVDVNVRRVLERHDGVTRPPAALRERAQALIPPSRAAEFNQATMELGATVCTARRPRCGACPVARGCAAAGAAPTPTPPQPERPRRRRERFEDTDRWLRGRIVAALVSGEPPPPADGQRLARAVAGLERDGLVVRGDDGALQLPSGGG
ncbi:MAG TPA: A/G-specific adenine glycosylase [Solirubrobacteraceae bacterium]|nr:A/G-specific adenine glycosylase [Solirubrobacteraceae bacterium]